MITKKVKIKAGDKIQLASDDFNRADGNAGTNWTTITTNGTMAISSNKIVSTTGAGDSQYLVYTSVSLPNNQYAECESTTNQSANGTGIGPIVRSDASGANHYGLAISNAGRLVLWKLVAGTYTDIANLPGQSYVAGKVLRLEVVGTILSIYYGGILINQVSDGSLSSGYTGIWVSGNTGGETFIADNFNSGAMNLFSSKLRFNRN